MDIMDLGLMPNPLFISSFRRTAYEKENIWEPLLWNCAHTLAVFDKNVFSFKYGDGIYGMEKFYEQEEGTVDVLILGPSLAFADINTATLWSEYGISAFHLGGSIQPMWNTYYYMKEALKYQRPKVMILEASVTNMMSDYSDQSRIIKIRME